MFVLIFHYNCCKKFLYSPGRFRGLQQEALTAGGRKWKQDDEEEAGTPIWACGMSAKLLQVNTSEQVSE